MLINENWRRWVGTVGLCSLLGCTQLAQAGVVKRFVPESSTWATLAPSVELETASNASESLLLRLDAMEGKNAQINWVAQSVSNISLQTYQVIQGTATSGAMDALQPLANNATTSIQSNTNQLLIKASIPAGTPAGTYRWIVQVLENRVVSYRGELKVTVYPLTLDKPNITLQGNLLFKRTDIPDAIVQSLLQKMLAYDFNSVILPKQYLKSDALSSLEQYVLDNFQTIRLSSRAQFSRNSTLSDTLVSAGLTRAQWLNEECNYINTLASKLRNRSKLGNNFVYKLWDEPLPINYPEVAYSYSSVRQCAPGIALELTEEPAVALGDIADIWTVNINALSENAIKTAKQQRDRIYLYANRFHDIQGNPQRIRSLGWLMGYFGIEGYHFWSVSDWDNGSFIQSIGETGNEERGTLFYWDPASNQILASLRMEMFHQGLDDMQLLAKVKSCAANPALKNSASAAQLLQRLTQVMQQWNFNAANAPVPAWQIYRKELLTNAVACNEVKMRRPLALTP